MTSDHIERLHHLMDTLNGRLCEGLQMRAKVVLELAAWSRETGIKDPASDDDPEMLAEITRDRGPGFDSEALQRIFRVIYEESRRLAATT